MDDIIHKIIKIPPDNDGYVLLQCQFCGTYFKLRTEDIEDDQILDIFCPSCGLISKSYLTKTVKKLAMAMASNIAIDYTEKFLENLEQSFQSNKFITIKRGEMPEKEIETPIQSSIDSLILADFKCCNKQVKVKPILKYCGCYCPFCGVKEFEFK